VGKVNSCCVVVPAGWTGVSRIKGKEKTSYPAGIHPGLKSYPIISNNFSHVDFKEL